MRIVDCCFAEQHPRANLFYSRRGIIHSRINISSHSYMFVTVPGILESNDFWQTILSCKNTFCQLPVTNYETLLLHWGATISHRRHLQVPSVEPAGLSLKQILEQISTCTPLLSPTSTDTTNDFVDPTVPLVSCLRLLCCSVISPVLVSITALE